MKSVKPRLHQRNMLCGATSNMLLVARNMLLVNINYVAEIQNMLRATSNLLQATNNLLPATCCSSAQLVAAQHVALV